MHQNHNDTRITIMIKEYNQILPGLEQDIISKIKKIEKRNILVKQTIFSLVSISSLIGTIILALDLKQAFSLSGTYEYISLIFSDISMITYWRELAMTIAETVPFLSLAFVLGALAMFFWSTLTTIKLQVFKTAVI